MPLGAKPICISCECNVSTLWRRSDSGDPICNACFTKQNDNGNQSNGSQNGNISIVKSSSNGHGPMLRKSSRIKPSKHKFISATKALATKGRSRRIIFKKSVRFIVLAFEINFYSKSLSIFKVLAFWFLHIFFWGPILYYLTIFMCLGEKNAVIIMTMILKRLQGFYRINK